MDGDGHILQGTTPPLTVRLGRLALGTTSRLRAALSFLALGNGDPLQRRPRCRCTSGQPARQHRRRSGAGHARSRTGASPVSPDRSGRARHRLRLSGSGLDAVARCALTRARKRCEPRANHRCAPLRAGHSLARVAGCNCACDQQLRQPLARGNAVAVGVAIWCCLRCAPRARSAASILASCRFLRQPRPLRTSAAHRRGRHQYRPDAGVWCVSKGVNSAHTIAAPWYSQCEYPSLLMQRQVARVSAMWTPPARGWPPASGGHRQREGCRQCRRFGDQRAEWLICVCALAGGLCYHIRSHREGSP